MGPLQRRKTSTHWPEPWITSGYHQKKGTGSKIRCSTGAFSLPNKFHKMYYFRFVRHILQDCLSANQMYSMGLSLCHENIISSSDLQNVLPLPLPSPLSLCTVCPSHCPALIVICWTYTDANSALGCVDVQLLVPGPQRLPRCHHPTTLSIKVPLPLTHSPHPLPCSPFEVTRVLFCGFLTPQKLSVASFLPMSGTHNRERAPAERFSSH